jgi:catechol 2,3-dioxygenase-like lactoylglutathione lyase family enzyme
MLDAIGIVGEDLQASLRFYAALGIAFAKEGELEHYEASAGGLRILLDSAALIRAYEPGWTKPTGGGFALCFKQDARNDVDRMYEQLLAAGGTGKKPPWDAFWGQRYACVLDPDGNQIDLFA